MGGEATLSDDREVIRMRLAGEEATLRWVRPLWFGGLAVDGDVHAPYFKLTKALFLSP
jgi:hypothetical protein